MIVNDPRVVAELAAVFADYEAALLANDVDALDRFFWNDQRTLRFGAAEIHYGHAAIAAYRRTISGILPRRLMNTVITTFGPDFGTANTEFQHVDDPRIGRQSQTWVRMGQTGWVIVAAHVSFLPPSSTPSA